jgi:hypothetical protein
MNRFSATLASSLVSLVVFFGGVTEARHHQVARHNYAHAGISVGGIHHTATFTTGRLEGRMTKDLYGVFFTNVGHSMPHSITVDYSNTLRDLWNAKLQRSRYRPEIKTVGERIIRDYDSKDPGRMSIAQYVAQADETSRSLCRSLDWARAGHGYFHGLLGIGTNIQKENLLRNMACQIGGRELVAYSLTELMPSEIDGAFNRDVYDLLLRTAGRRYIESVPAVYDHMISIGPYQFTSYALYDNGRDRRGASVPNQYLPETLRIPANVIGLRGNDHFKAVWLFAVDNEAHLLRKLNSHELSVMERGWRSYRSDLMVYVATAHHLPAPAISAARRWLDHDAHQPYYRSCATGLGRYAIRSMNNYRVL